MNKLLLATLLSAGLVNAAQADIRITEWMYNPAATSGEFIEFTNMGNSAVDFTGWSFDDNSRTPGSQSLSAFGIVQAGESVILTETTDAFFRGQWNLATTVKVIGGNTNNLGRSDEINLYDATNTLIDRLTYNDQGTGTVDTYRTQGVSGNPGSLAAIGANNASLWALSAVGDAEGSYQSNTGANFDIGNPGTTSYAAPVPEADTYALLMAGLGLVGFLARRRKN
ncbi:MAG: PEP-CTERM sorting domain-containing protein [Hydrogenophilales bacterium 28-61-23]|nr:MAG: PEP-CTERM sorting domain-containing protein [Hydrogenophilales bacterium 28-61-23]